MDELNLHLEIERLRTALLAATDALHVDAIRREARQQALDDAANLVEHGRYVDGGFIHKDPPDAIAYQIRRLAGAAPAKLLQGHEPFNRRST